MAEKQSISSAGHLRKSMLPNARLSKPCRNSCEIGGEYDEKPFYKPMF
jgi:hypothetical protein